MFLAGQYGTGFKPSSYMTPHHQSSGELVCTHKLPAMAVYLLKVMQEQYTEFDTPHIIVTYTALLSLAILRDDFSKLDRPGLLTFLRACQREDGRYALPLLQSL